MPQRTGCASGWRRRRELQVVRDRRLRRVRRSTGLGLHRLSPGHRTAIACGAATGRASPVAHHAGKHGAATMSPIRRRRLWFVAAVLAASTVIPVLVALALRHNVAFLYTPADIPPAPPP